VIFWYLLYYPTEKDDPVPTYSDHS
jgi:hypothetical protein